MYYKDRLNEIDEKFDLIDNFCYVKRFDEEGFPNNKDLVRRLEYMERNTVIFGGDYYSLIYAFGKHFELQESILRFPLTYKYVLFP